MSKNERTSILAGSKPWDNARIEMMKALKERMVDWVLEAIWNDPEAPKRLHELLKSKKSSRSDYEDQLGVNGRFFTAFVYELSDHWRLPTKKAVRARAGAGDTEANLSAASGVWRKLGLSGLPQG